MLTRLWKEFEEKFVLCCVVYVVGLLAVQLTLRSAALENEIQNHSGLQAFCFSFMFILF